MIDKSPQAKRICVEFAGQRIVDLARRFGTPLSICDPSVIETGFALLSNFDRVRQSISTIAQDNLLKRLQKMSVVMRVGNGNEFRRAVAIGIDPATLLYASNAFDRDGLDEVIRLGLAVRCGSLDMIDQFGQRRPGANVSLHIAANQIDLTSDRCSALDGICISHLEDALFRCDQYGITVTGVHFSAELGSTIARKTIFEAIEVCVQLIGRTVSVISVEDTGDAKVDEFDSQAKDDSISESLFAIRDALVQSLGHRVEIEFDPGKCFIDRSAILVSEIRAVKKRGEQRYYLINADWCVMMNPSLRGTEFGISICPKEGATHERPFVDAVVCASLSSGHPGTPLASLASRPLPIAIAGDYAVFSDMGSSLALFGGVDQLVVRSAVSIENDGVRLVEF